MRDRVPPPPFHQNFHGTFLILANKTVCPQHGLGDLLDFFRLLLDRPETGSDSDEGKAETLIGSGEDTKPHLLPEGIPRGSDDRNVHQVFLDRSEACAVGSYGDEL